MTNHVLRVLGQQANDLALDVGGDLALRQLHDGDW